MDLKANSSPILKSVEIFLFLLIKIVDDQFFPFHWVDIVVFDLFYLSIVFRGPKYIKN